MIDHTDSFYGNTVRLFYGINVIDGLRMLPTESVQCIVTSPPYWGLRNYNTDPQLWGGDPNCEHEWEQTDPRRKRSANDVVDQSSKQATSRGTQHDLVPANVCTKCNGWLGELGQEPTPELFVEHLVLIFRECRRVLRNDGVLFLNIGDSYASGWSCNRRNIVDNGSAPLSERVNRLSGNMKDKDLVMIPAQTALALRADGWYLRAENVWAKPNPMPESVTDRTTRSHEMVYLLTKKKDYFYDHEAIKTPALDPQDDIRRITQANEQDKRSSDNDNISRVRRSDKQRGHSRRHDGFNDRWNSMSKEEQQQGGANLRSVWWIATQPYSGSHYATFPEALPELCIKAGSSEQCCSKCGSPYARITEVIGHQVTEAMRTAGCDKNGEYSGTAQKDYESANAQDPSSTKARILKKITQIVRHDWKPSCTCNAEPGRCTILDPFMGSGTTAAVALVASTVISG